MYINMMYTDIMPAHADDDQWLSTEDVAQQTSGIGGDHAADLADEGQACNRLLWLVSLEPTSIFFHGGISEQVQQKHLSADAGIVQRAANEEPKE